jgi:hypothetical protein
LAAVGGNANGNDEADRKVIERTGIGGLLGEGRSNCVASENFSGIAKNEDILYL